MTASLNDSAVLSTDALFQGRVRESLALQCANVASEPVTTAFHYARQRLVVQIINSIEISNGNQSVWVSRFSIVVATDATVLADATAAGTVALTSANVDTQQALITDTHINNAVSAQINTFLYPA